MDIQKLIARHGLVSDQVDAAELIIILRELIKVLEADVPGAIVEFGCYRGTTSLYLRRVLDAFDPARPLHVYDSFAGLPEKTAPDVSPLGTQFVAGELSTSKKEFVAEFARAELKLPVVHKGWFGKLAQEDVPEPVAFAFLDGDYYESIRDSLRLMRGRLSPGATIIVDDYANDALPGVYRAVGEWLPRGCEVRTVASLGVVKNTCD